MHAPLPPATATGATPGPPAGRTGSLRILLVDDHEDTTRAMGRLLQAWGHTVRTANTVGSAIDTFSGGGQKAQNGQDGGAGSRRAAHGERLTPSVGAAGTAGAVVDAGAASPAGTGVASAGVPFDLLISDIGLPDGSGLELIRQLHRMYPQDPVRGIALSGFGMEEDVKKSREAGFYAHLTKPVDFQKLQAVIRQATAG